MSQTEVQSETPLVIRTVKAMRYVTPLREGGSMPAIVEADDDGLYVLKFRGAGQGQRALVAELIAGEIGRALGLPVPEIVFVDLDAALGRSEGDPEIQALISASVGLNLALDYLPGSLDFDPARSRLPDEELASAIVWFDAFVTNVDRTPRNPNLLVWHKKHYMIDHGASLYFHHSWDGYQRRSRDAFPAIRDHVLLPRATAIQDADRALSARLSPSVIEEIIGAIPDTWLGDEPSFASIAEHRHAYATYLNERLAARAIFVEESLNARARLV